MPTLQIDHIHLDLRGLSPGVAQSALASFGPALHRAIAAQTAGRTAGAYVQIERVSAPPLRLSPRVDAPGLRDALAGHLASTIADQLNPPSRP